MDFIDKELLSKVLERVRRRFETWDNLDDEQALIIIEEELFALDEAENLSIEELQWLSRKVFYKTRKKLGVLTPYLEDKRVTEIMVNGPRCIFAEVDGEIRKVKDSFDGTEELEEVMQTIASGVHREINELNPIVDARLEDGSRVNGVYKNIAVGGPILTIRKFSEGYMKLADLIDNGTVSREGAMLLEALVACRYNIFVSGGTSSGKTTLLNALSQFIPSEERVIVIEDSTELKLSSVVNLVQLECRQGNMEGRGMVTMAQLIKTSLRMRPDRIIVGEVRGAEVLDMLQAMNTGHAGSMSTGHGNSIRGMLRRLEAMYLMAMPLNIEAIRRQIAEGIEIMVHIEKINGKRIITEICELTGYDGDNFVLNTLMERDQSNCLKGTGNFIENKGKLMRGEKKYIDELQGIGIVN